MRLAANAMLFLAVLFLPWWTALIVGAAFFFIFPRYYELMFAGLLMDLLYGAPLPRFGGFQFVGALGAVALYLLFSFMKTRMRI